jgi:hypothetical protein
MNDRVDPWMFEQTVTWEPFATWITWYFCNEDRTAMAQLVSAMVFGILLSPWSGGLFFLVAFIIVYELAYYVFAKGDPRYYDVETRPCVIAGSLFGYILGKTLMSTEDNMMYSGFVEDRITQK